MFDAVTGSLIVDSMNAVIGNYLSWSPVVYVVMVVLGIFSFRLILGSVVRVIIAGSYVSERYGSRRSVKTSYQGNREENEDAKS